MMRPATILRWTFIAASLGFILLPTIIIIPLSFNDRSYFVFPPDRYSLRWYHDFFESPEWMDSLWASLQIGVMAAALFQAAFGDAGMPGGQAVEISETGPDLL